MYIAYNFVKLLLATYDSAISICNVYVIDNYSLQDWKLKEDERMT